MVLIKDIMTLYIYCVTLILYSYVRACALWPADAHGATDVTGFGILGHAQNLASCQKNPVNFCLHTLPSMFWFVFYENHNNACTCIAIPGLQPCTVSYINGGSGGACNVHSMYARVVHRSLHCCDGNDCFCSQFWRRWVLLPPLLQMQGLISNFMLVTLQKRPVHWSC